MVDLSLWFGSRGLNQSIHDLGPRSIFLSDGLDMEEVIGPTPNPLLLVAIFMPAAGITLCSTCLGNGAPLISSFAPLPPVATWSRRPIAGSSLAAGEPPCGGLALAACWVGMALAGASATCRVGVVLGSCRLIGWVDPMYHYYDTAPSCVSKMRPRKFNSES